MLGYELFKGES